MYSPLTIANFFIKKGIEFSDPISQTKIQRLVYIAHGWYLALTGNPLINSVVEAWRFGPIIPEIYDAFKAYGNLPLKHVIDNKESINKEVKKLLEVVWNLYGRYSTFFLSNFTHQSNTPWDIVAKEYSYNIPANKDIDDRIIRAYFTSLSKKMSLAGV